LATAKRDDRLDGEIFSLLAEARRVIETWLRRNDAGYWLIGRPFRGHAMDNVASQTNTNRDA
jgi:hypothetical protein